MILAAMIAIGAAATAPSGSATRYFPDAAEAGYRCPAVGSPRMPVVSPFEAQWFSSRLAAASEPALYAPPGKRRPGISTIRFTWLRSFHPAMIVRIERTAEGPGRVAAVRLSRAGGMAAGRTDRRIDRALVVREARALDAILRATRIKAVTPRDCSDMIMLDGAEWIVEIADAAGYHVVIRNSPQNGPVRELGLAMLGLTGWTLDPVY